MCALSVISRGRFMLCTTPQSGEAIAEGVRGVLDASVAVEDGAGPWTPMEDSAVQGT